MVKVTTEKQNFTYDHKIMDPNLCISGLNSSGTLVSRCVNFLREGEGKVKIWKKVAAYVIGVFLSLSLVGIIIVYDAVKEWKWQEKNLHKDHRQIEEKQKVEEERVGKKTKEMTPDDFHANIKIEDCL